MIDIHKTIEDLITYIDDLEKRIKDLETINEQHRKINGELRTTINKAIEYIKTCNPDVDLYSMFLSEYYISNYGAVELLEILGDSNE